MSVSDGRRKCNEIGRKWKEAVATSYKDSRSLGTVANPGSSEYDE